jgi:hypothetical protein
MRSKKPPGRNAWVAHALQRMFDGVSDEKSSATRIAPPPGSGGRSQIVEPLRAFSSLTSS